jgi:hypothetical protein
MKNTSQDLFQSSTANMTPSMAKPMSSPNTPNFSETVNRLAARRPQRSIPARRRVRGSLTPSAMENQRLSSFESQNGNVAVNAETITSPGNQSGPTPLAPKTLASNPEIVRITLDTNQAAILGPILDHHRAKTKITGVLCALTRSFRPSAGCTTLEMQVLEADQRTIAALIKIARG